MTRAKARQRDLNGDHASDPSDGSWTPDKGLLRHLVHELNKPSGDCCWLTHDELRWLFRRAGITYEYLDGLR